MLKLSRRLVTFEDYLDLKKLMPFSKHRRKSKGINFSAEFGAAGPSIGTQLREHYQFTESDCDETIESLGMEDVYNQALANRRTGETDLQVKYRVVGTKFRDLFFATYPGLMRRIVREQAFAKKKGYTRTWVGPIRHFPELRYMKFTPKGELAGADRKAYSKMVAHFKNDSVNTSIQTAEVQHAMPDIVAIQMNLNDWGLKSFIYNYIHDSWEMAIYKPEKDVVFALCNKIAQIRREPYGNIPVYVDAELSDYDKGHYFKHGEEMNIEKYDIDIELAKFNELYGLNLKFTDYSPYTIEGRKNLRKSCNYEN